MMSWAIECLLVRPLVACLAPYGPPLPYGARNVVLDHAAAFVTRQISIAPFHVRIGVLTLGVPLRLWLALVAPGVARSFGAPLRAARAVELFERLPGPAHVVVRFYRSLTILAYYEHAVVAPALDFPDPIARQDTFRTLRRTRLSQEAA